MATRTISDAGGNFNATGTRVEGVVPVAGDAVVAQADGTSGQLTINVVSGGVGLLSFNLTNYTNTVTWTSTLTVNGTVILAGTHTGTAGTLIIAGTTAITTNTITIPCKLTITGIGTTTLNENITVAGLVTCGGTVGTQTINGYKILCQSSFTCGTLTTHLVSGTTVIEFSSSTNGTWLGTGYLKLPITINKSGGTLTVGGVISRVPLAVGTTFTYTAGTLSRGAYYINCLLTGTRDTDRGGGNHLTFPIFSVIGTQSLTTDLYCDTLRLTGTGTFSGAGKINSDWSVTNLDLLPTAAGVRTLTADWTCTNLDLPAATLTMTLNTNNLYITGNITGTGTTGATLGTTTMRYTGTGTWGVTNTNSIRNPFIINTAGTLTLGAKVYYDTGTMTYTAGTVDTTSNNSTLYISLATTLNTDGIARNFITITGAVAGYNISLTSLLTATEIMILYYTVSFIGTFGFTVTDFIVNATIVAGQYVSLITGKTYTVNGRLRLTACEDYPLILKSSTTTPAILNYNGSDQRVLATTAQYIDSSGGNRIYDIAGTLLGCDNRAVSNVLSQPLTIAQTFVG